ncbi:hypothetical protein INR49_020564 [Caranx melampygus]|nr:hypothetical protein INR49_020564 [Caranx melampygus]
MSESHGDSRLIKTLNFNIGVLGHVDSGKTSLARALSSTASTAAFDKNPQSRERGITLDLGFSSFTVDLPEQLRSGQQQYDSLQFTLVDCPGHASLIRTIIGDHRPDDAGGGRGEGGADSDRRVSADRRADLPRMVVVLNKIDLLPPNKRQAAIEKMTKRLHKTLESTRVSCDCCGGQARGPEAPDTEEPQGVPELIELLKKQTYLPQRDPGGDLLMAVDHCFSIRGQGTVMTGTILQGSLAINDTVEIPALKVTKKIKSVQMFRKPVSGAMQGDRVAVGAGGGVHPGLLHTLHAAVISVRKIGYFKGSLATRAKFHITVGHETVMARVTFFGLPPSDAAAPPPSSSPPAPQLPGNTVHLRQGVLLPDDTSPPGDTTGPGPGPEPEQWALLEFERPVTCPSLCLVIGSKLDTDIHATRAAGLPGSSVTGFEDKNFAETLLPCLRIYKTKHRRGRWSG